MCGRTRCTLRPEDVPRASHRHNLPARFLHLDRYRPSYNVAPGSYMPVLRRDNNDGVAVHCMKWGLVPSFTNKTDKPDFFKMFNARSESVAEKASFRRLLPKNRCLVTVDGFYEWKKEGSKKQPYYIHFKDERPLVFAALFDSYEAEMLFGGYGLSWPLLYMVKSIIKDNLGDFPKKAKEALLIFGRVLLREGMQV